MSVDIDSANEYLNNIFIPKINAKFSYKINKTMMKENNSFDLELNLIISEKYERLIDNASTVKYKNNSFIYDILNIITFLIGENYGIHI